MRTRIQYEKTEGGSAISTHQERRKNIAIDLDKYIFSGTGDRWIYAKEKEIPMTVESQKAYLDQLINQWYFAVIDDYNNRSSLLTDLLHSMACTVSSWVIFYKVAYIKYSIIQAHKAGKLSDFCLKSLIETWLWNSMNNDSDQYDILAFLKNIHGYPDLIKKIIIILREYFLQNKKGMIVGSHKYYPEETKGVDLDDTRQMIEKWLL